MALIPPDIAAASGLTRAVIIENLLVKITRDY